MSEKVDKERLWQVTPRSDEMGFHKELYTTFLGVYVSLDTERRVFQGNHLYWY